MESYIYFQYKDLPATKIAEEQIKKAKEVYALTMQAIQQNLKAAEAEFVAKRDIARAAAEWDYTVTFVFLEDVQYFKVTRKAINPLEGDTDFYKDIEYASFRIVNNVFISCGSGYLFNKIKTGDILTVNEIAMLECNRVPERFK